MTLQFNLEDYAILASSLYHRKERIKEMLKIFEADGSVYSSYERELRSLEAMEIKLYKEVYKDTQLAL